MPGAVIIGGARTPIGKLSGALKAFPAVDLGGLAIAEALRRARMGARQVDHVIMGQVLQAGAAQITARQAAVKGGIPMSVPALTVNKVGLSGMAAVALADQLIGYGEFDVVVAGGMESMTNAPYLVPWRLDLPDIDGCARRAGIGRAEQDEFAARSHERAAVAMKSGVFDDEIVAVSVPQRQGEPVVVSDDEGVRPGTTARTLGALRPAFVPDGTVTAGTASQPSDGACALVIASHAKAEELGVPVLAEIGAHGAAAGPDPSLLSQPANAVRRALAREELDPTGVDLYEINEAFAAVAIQSMKELGVDQGRVNVNGGAIAMGNPVGASGARIVLHLALELARRGGGVGAAGLCSGGGQGDALVLRVPGDG